MSKKTIHSDAAPQAIGTYSQAVETNGLLFISGQIPLDPATMELVEGDFETRARRVFENLQAIATTAGATMDQAVKLTIYLTDLGNFASVNSVMAEYFQEPYPARAALGVASLPKGADIEAEAIVAL